MAVNTDEEHLENQKNTQSENVSGEIIPTKEAETINLNQESENMEVHHHPDLHHRPKKWKEYFLEFLMIFLAVTLGFFAESIRENISNRHKESKYMESLVSDLKSDTTETDIAIRRWKGYNANLDSLLILLKKDMSQQNINGLYALLSTEFFHFNLFKYKLTPEIPAYCF